MNYQLKFALSNGCNLGVLIFEKQEHRLIWDHLHHPKAGDIHQIKTHICATYLKGILQTVDACFSIRRREEGEGIVPYTMTISYHVQEKDGVKILVAKEVDTGRFATLRQMVTPHGDENAAFRAQLQEVHPEFEKYPFAILNKDGKMDFIWVHYNHRQ